MIRHVKEAVRIPVIGSGDVTGPYSAIMMRKETGCDGIMIGRAALTSPWIFRQILDLEQTGSFKEEGLDARLKVIRGHFSLLLTYFGEKRGTNIMKGPLLLYTKGLPYKKVLLDCMPEIDGKETFNSHIVRYFKHITKETAHEG